jgi:hypothetical protein
VIAALALGSALASAQVADECRDQVAAAASSGYAADRGQRDFLLNYFALATTYSPLHGPTAAEPGHGTVGLEASAIPPLDCQRRLVSDGTQVVDTTPLPVLPRLRLAFALPKLGPAAIYGGLGYTPPIEFLGVRSVVTSGEVGVGATVAKGLEAGVRYHFTMIKAVGEFATPEVEGDPAVQDLYVGSTFGVDGMLGWQAHPAVVPYVALGFTDASTYFYAGDDGMVSNNYSPYAGFVGSVGAQARWKWFLAAAEFYTAPGTLYTGRLQVGATL